MILRINEFDPANAEPYSGWGACPLRGGITYDWSSEAHAFEVLILDSDENRQSLSNTFRQARLRELLPELVAALVEPSDHLVLRLDGPLAPGEMIAAYRHLCDVDGDGRFAISGVQRVDPLAPAAIGSVRIELTARRLTQMCAEHSLGIEREVRLRLFAVP